MRRRVLSCIIFLTLCINLLPSTIFADSLGVDSGIAPSTYEESTVKDEENGMEFTDVPEFGLPDKETGENDNEMNPVSENETEGERKDGKKDLDTSVITDVSTEDGKDSTIRNVKNEIEKNDIEVIQEDVSPDGDIVLTKESCNEAMMAEFDEVVQEVTDASSDSYTCFFQTDSRWASTKYGRVLTKKGNYYQAYIGLTKTYDGETFYYGSGCGLLALTNAVYALNGTFLNPSDLASWSLANGCRIDGQGTTHNFPEKYVKAFGNSMGVKFDGDVNVINNTVKNHIVNGGVAVINVVEHFACLVSYDSNSGKYLALDSAPTSSRMDMGTGKIWLTENELKNHSKWKVSAVHLLSRLGQTCNCSDSYAGSYRCTTSSLDLNIRPNHDGSGNPVGKIPSGAEVWVSKANGSWAHVSYNGINGYASMTYLQKSTNYPEPGYVGAAGGTRYTPSSIWWDKGSNVRCYDVRIYKDGNLINTFWNLKESEMQTWLPEGTYHVTVAYVNDAGWKNALNEADFTVGPGSCLNLGDHFYGNLIINNNWLNIAAKNDGDVKVGSEADEVNSFWEFIRQSDGSYCIRNCENGKVLDVYNGNSASGTNVIVADDHGGANQRWYIYGRWSGEYILKPKNSECVLDVSGGENKVGDNIQIWDLNYTDAQKYAIWTLSSYSVSFNANGGSGAPGNLVKVEGKALKLPGAVPKRDGYTFVNWNTSADGSGAAYQAGSQYNENAAVTLYAQWKQNMFALDVNGHLDSDDSASNINGYGTVDVYINGNLVADDVSDYYMEHPYGTTYEIKDIRVKSGKSYAGISSGARQGTISGITKISLHFVSVPDSSGVEPVIGTFGGHTYYYFDRHSTWYEAMHFSEKLGGHLVTINNREENDFVSSLVGDKNIWMGLTDEAVEGAWTWVNGEGLSFTNWSSGEPNNHTQLVEDGEDYGVLLGDGSWNDAVGPEQISFVCEFDKAYTVRYDLSGGSGELGNQEKAHGKAITLSSILPTKDGYAFSGWNTARDGGGMAYNAGAPYTEDADVTLYAQWKTAGKEMAYGYARTVPDGEYQIVAYRNPGYMLDIDGNDVPASDGSNVQLYSNENRPQDTFLLTYDSSDGCYSIIQKDTQMSLDVVDAAVTEGANVQMYHWHDVSAQKWAISWVGDVGNGIGYRIQSKCNGLSLDIVNGGSDSVYVNGTNVRMWPGNNSQAQSWMLIPVNTDHDIKDGRYILRSGVKPVLELDVSGDSYDVQGGTNIQVWNDDSKDFYEHALSQYNAFDVSYIGEGYYKITHAGSGLALEVAGASKERLANVCLGEEAADDYGQQWAVTAFGDGYMLRARCSGQALDVADGRTEDGTNVRQHPCAFGEAQLWYFVPAEYAVSYDANGGSGAPGSQTKYYKGQLILDAAEPERFGHVFSGWNTDRNGQGTSYAAGSLYETDADVTMYAQWTKRSYKVTYDANGGTGSPDKQMKEYGDAIRLSDVVPTKQGCDFTGWNTKADGTGIAYKSNDQYVKDEDLTLYAQWENASDPMAPAPTIEVGTVKALAGNTVSVPLNIKNNPGIVSMELSIEYDADMLIWTGFEPGEFGGKIDGEVGKNLTWFGEDPKTDVTLDALIMVLNFAVKDDAEHGDAVVTVSYRDHDIFNADERNIAFEVVPGKVAVSAYTPGDINGDGMVDNKDVIRLMRHLKYNDVEYVADALDVNGDGEVGNKDVTRLMRYLKYNDVPIF